MRGRMKDQFVGSCVGSWLARSGTERRVEAHGVERVQSQRKNCRVE